MDPEHEVVRTTFKFLSILIVAFVFSACVNKFPGQSSVSNVVEAIALTQDSMSISTSPGNLKTIYLTFDDGPNKGTSNVLQSVTEEKVPATMFVIGQHINGSAKQSAIYQEMLTNRFVEIENHSYTHGHNKFDRFYHCADFVAADFMRCADSLQLRSNIVRTPGRNIWRLPGISFTDVKKTAALADTLHQKGLSVVGWDIEWRYDKHLRFYKTADELFAQINGLFEKNELQTPNHLVLLAHDQQFIDSASNASLRMLIQKLKATGEYNFQVISNYPALKNSVVKNDIVAIK